ncbi:MAG: hypothetical protein GKC10_01365 [Methanosarcinales archaeon]|nr:hypothetical protein [Methanosarcinales archaeon]
MGKYAAENNEKRGDQRKIKSGGAQGALSAGMQNLFKDDIPGPAAALLSSGNSSLVAVQILLYRFGHHLGLLTVKKSWFLAIYIFSLWWSSPSRSASILGILPGNAIMVLILEGAGA